MFSTYVLFVKFNLATNCVSCFMLVFKQFCVCIRLAKTYYKKTMTFYYCYEKNLLQLYIYFFSQIENRILYTRFVHSIKIKNIYFRRLNCLYPVINYICYLSSYIQQCLGYISPSDPSAAKRRAKTGKSLPRPICNVNLFKHQSDQTEMEILQNNIQKNYRNIHQSKTSLDQCLKSAGTLHKRICPM